MLENLTAGFPDLDFRTPLRQSEALGDLVPILCREFTRFHVIYNSASSGGWSATIPDACDQRLIRFFLVRPAALYWRIPDLLRSLIVLWGMSPDQLAAELPTLTLLKVASACRVVSILTRVNVHSCRLVQDGCRKDRRALLWTGRQVTQSLRRWRGVRNNPGNTVVATISRLDPNTVGAVMVQWPQWGTWPRRYYGCAGGRDLVSGFKEFLDTSVPVVNA